MDVLFYEEHIRALGLCTFGLEGYRGNGGQKVWNENAQNGFTLGTFFAFALQTLSQKSWLWPISYDFLIVLIFSIVKEVIS